MSTFVFVCFLQDTPSSHVFSCRCQICRSSHRCLVFGKRFFSIAVSVFRPIGFCKLGAFSMMLQHTTLRSCLQPLTLISARIYRSSVIGGTCSNFRAIVIGPAFPMCDKFWLCLFDPCHHSSTLSVLPGHSNDDNSQYFLHVILTLSSPIFTCPASTNLELKCFS